MKNEEVDEFVASLGDGDEPLTPARRRVSRPFPSEPIVPLVDREEDDDTSIDIAAMELSASTPQKPRKQKKKFEPPEDTVISSVTAVSAPDDDIEIAASLLPTDLPQPSKEQTLGGLIAKYGIGNDSGAGYKIQLNRLDPKYYKGVAIGGFIQEYEHEITQQTIADEYGGGVYQLRVVGPDPKTLNGSRFYESVKIQVAGEPNPSRLPRSQLAAQAKAAAPPPSPPPQLPAGSENPAITKITVDVLQKQIENARQDRIMAEQRSREVETAPNPLLEAERRHHADMMSAAEERAAIRERNLQEALNRQIEETRRLSERMDAMSSAPSTSPVEDMGKLLAMMPKADNEAAARSSEAITKSILDRHAAENAQIHQQHAAMLESMRASHLNEIQSMRDASRREIEAEREASRTREQRAEERQKSDEHRYEQLLKTEREERRRDQETAKRNAEDRDQVWKDRNEQQEINLRTSWESRIETLKSNYESQITWLKAESEKLEAKNRDLESKLAALGDPFEQFRKMNEMKTTFQSTFGLTEPSSGMSGGIGLDEPSAPAGFDWGDAIKNAMSMAPELIKQFTAQPGQQQEPQQFQPPPPPPTQQYQPGQIVPTPQGEMIVINTRDGLALARKSDYDARMAQQAPQGRTSRPQNRAIPAEARPSTGIPVPDMSIGLPKPRPWGEAVQPPMPVDSAPVQRQNPAPSEHQKQQGVPVNMSPLEKMVAEQVAKLVNDSVFAGEQPRQFVEKITKGSYPAAVIHGLAQKTDSEIIDGIRAVQPNSAGTTAAGQRFVRQAMALLRQAVAQGA